MSLPSVFSEFRAAQSKNRGIRKFTKRQKMYKNKKLNLQNTTHKSKD